MKYTTTNFFEMFAIFSVMNRFIICRPSFCNGRTFTSNSNQINSRTMRSSRTFTNIIRKSGMLRCGRLAVRSFYHVDTVGGFGFLCNPRKKYCAFAINTHHGTSSLSNDVISSSSSLLRSAGLKSFSTTISLKRCFGTKRPMVSSSDGDNDGDNDNGEESSTFQGVPGSITIYNEQTTLPNIDISKIEQTISIIREIINYPTYDVNLILVDDEDMKQTNYETRQINKPTDILSFPFHDTVLGGAKGAGLLEEPEFDIPDYYTLGDMMIDVPYVIRRCDEDKVYNGHISELQKDSVGVDEGIELNPNDDMEGKEDEEYEIVEVEYDDYVGDDDRGVSRAMATIYDPEERIRMLLVHGMLHLVGYDHIEDDDYEVMVSKEEEVLELLNSRLKEMSLQDATKE